MLNIFKMLFFIQCVLQYNYCINLLAWSWPGTKTTELTSTCQHFNIKSISIHQISAYWLKCTQATVIVFLHITKSKTHIKHESTFKNCKGMNSPCLLGSSCAVQQPLCVLSCMSSTKKNRLPAVSASAQTNDLEQLKANGQRLHMG